MQRFFIILLLVFFNNLNLNAQDSIPKSKKELKKTIEKNKETGEVYWTSKNKKKVERKIELKKFSKKLRKRIVFKETKK
jgi:large subunit ribosomal protein L33